ncbi:MAG: carbohydrate-binding family 9-like protein [Flavobacteriaceae bacterium]
MKTKIIALKLLCIFWIGCTSQNDTKVLVVKAIDADTEAIDISKVPELLEAQTSLHQISTLNWEAFPYQPKVTFRIGHYNNQIWLRFYITEDHVLATRTKTNSATHKDSCLEFFIDPKEDGNYYNFEVNAIGTVHLAYGPSIRQRTFISPKLIQDKIKVSSTMGNTPFEEKTQAQSWEMTMVIPADILIHETNLELTGLETRANFYKCGDDSTVPHYLSWNPVGTDRPNFHTPEYFGKLIFE